MDLWVIGCGHGLVHEGKGNDEFNVSRSLGGFSVLSFDFGDGGLHFLCGIVELFDGVVELADRFGGLLCVFAELCDGDIDLFGSEGL